ncbi:MAG: hypothetical protein AB7S26_14080 [Sandaracinaceae bacterium]
MTTLEDDAMVRLRALGREVDEAYDRIEAPNAAPQIDEAALARARTQLEHALAREAEAAQGVLDRRLPSLERTSESTRRAEALIAKHERDAE